ncbi:MAG: hypothetical protein ACXACG_02960 [Candidatus Thorarchaeota archaeon]
MSDDYEEPSHEPGEMNDAEWDEYRVYLEERQERIKLDRKDYVALFIASLETIFLPLVILIIVFLAFGLLFLLI